MIRLFYLDNMVWLLMSNEGNFKFQEKIVFRFEHIYIFFYEFTNFKMYAIEYHGETSQSAITCSKLTREALEQGVKYVRS